MTTKSKERIIIFDTTLRDGEQAPGATMTVGQKIEIALALDGMGVDVIEAGFAAASSGDFDCIEQISQVTNHATVCSLARAKLEDITAAASALKGARKPRIHTFISTSALHLTHQFKITQDEAIVAIKSSVQHARNLCDDVEWSAMDATRSDMDFLSRAVEVAIDAGARTINIPDTVGYITPEEYAALITALKNNVPNIDKAILSVHCHNDLGMAVANSMAAIRAGARQIECTINGIGERAGNAALEEIIMTIKTRADQFPFDLNVDPTHIAAVSELVSAHSGFMVQRNKAIVGENAFAHESGIHQDGWLKCRETYEIMTPESVGFSGTKLTMGKHSGRAAFRHKLAALNLHVEDEIFAVLFKKFKAMGDTQKEISDEDILALVSGKETKIASPIYPEKGVIWMDGEFVPWCDANVPVLTHGLHYASSVFEGERVYQGKVFKLREHNERLHASAAALGFSIPYSVDELNSATERLVRRNKLQEAYIRPIAWCGDETMSVASHACRVHVAIAAWPWKSYFSDEQSHTSGIKLMWADWVRPAPSTAPVTAKAAGLYMIGSLSKNKAEQAGFHDALMLDYRGFVAECTSANFFMVKNGAIHTPIADCFLNGITRQTVIAIAKQHHMPVVERHIYPFEVTQADEVFVTGSAVEVLPVSQIGHHQFKVGEITRAIMSAYHQLVRGEPVLASDKMCYSEAS